MSSDTETLGDPKKIKSKSPSNEEDFPSMGVNLIKKINFKVSIFLFFIGIFIFSDIFIENILPKNTIDGFCTNTQGTMIQLLSFVIAYIILDLMVQGEII